jgi:DNA-binding NtrC family response regulator
VHPIHVLRVGCPHSGPRQVAERLAARFKLDFVPSLDGDGARETDVPECDAILVDPSGQPASERIAWTCEVLQHIGERRPEIRPVTLVELEDAELACAALDAGSWTIAPADPAAVEKRLLAAARLRRLGADEGGEEEAEDGDGGPLLGSSEPIRQVRSQIDRVAGSDVPVLITGESGTGKELAAALIHDGSGRGAGPFIAINCGAIPESLLEAELFGCERGAFTGATRARLGRLRAAEGGTLLLDEVGELAPSLQSKLLRFLQDHKVEPVGARRRIPVDVRVIAATNRDLREAMQDGAFREDLYYRLAVFELRMPRLAERGDDVVRLARHFVRRFNADRCCGRGEARRPAPIRGLSCDAIEALRGAEWPGNVRELINRVRRALLLAQGPLLTAADLGLAGGSSHEIVSLRDARHEADARCIRRALRRHGWRKRETAKALGISRTRLYELMRSYEIEDRAPY